MCIFYIVKANSTLGILANCGGGGMRLDWKPLHVLTVRGQVVVGGCPHGVGEGVEDGLHPSPGPTPRGSHIKV